MLSMTGWIIVSLFAAAYVAVAVWVYRREKAEEIANRKRDGRWYGRAKK